MDVPASNPQDNGQKICSHDEAMARRLKNRERQRRYRERKRLRADPTKVLDTNQFASIQVEVPVIAASQDSALPVNVAPLDSAMPVNVAPLDSAMPVNVVPLDSAMPVNVAPPDSAMPVNVAPLYSARPANDAPQEYAMPVNVAPQEYAMPVDVASGKCVMPVSSGSREVVTRVYSGRNWKSDARKAHAMRQGEVCSNGSVSADLASAGGNQAPSLPHVEQSSPVTPLENNGTPKSIPSRRHWKADARNKRS